MTNKEVQKDAVDFIRRNVKGTVYFLTVGRARSGMSRTVRAFHAKGGTINDVTRTMSLAIGKIPPNDNGIVVRGCGSNAHQHVIEQVNAATRLTLRCGSL